MFSKTFFYSRSGGSIKPLISVCIPCYNSEKYLAQTLNSIAQQTYENFECIVVDNCSSDNTVSIAESFRDKFKYFRIITSNKTVSGEDNFNKCFSLASGSLVCIYHSDDVYDHKILERCSDFLIRNPDCGAVSTMGRMIDDKDDIIAKRFKMPFRLLISRSVIFRFNELLSLILSMGGNSFLICPSVMMRKDVIDQTAGFEYSKFGSASDVGLWLRIAKLGGMGVLSESLIKYRIHKAQGTESLIRSSYLLPDLLKVIEYYRIYTNGYLKKKIYLFWAAQLAKLACRRLQVNKISFDALLVMISLKFLKKSFPVFGIQCFHFLYYFLKFRILMALRGFNQG